MCTTHEREGEQPKPDTIDGAAVARTIELEPSHRNRCSLGRRCLGPRGQAVSYIHNYHSYSVISTRHTPLVYMLKWEKLPSFSVLVGLHHASMHMDPSHLLRILRVYEGKPLPTTPYRMFI